MKIYNYHPVTKEFISESTPDLDPLESTQEVPVYLIPAYATEVAPPEVKVNKARLFNETDQSWYYLPDFRGQEVTATDGSNRKQVINVLGMTPEDVEFPLVVPVTNKTTKDYILAMMDYLIAPTEEKKSTLIEQYQEYLNAN